MYGKRDYPTLVLNGNADPLDVWSWRHGISAVLSGTAISLCDYGVEARSMRGRTPLPSVAMLRRFHHSYRLAPFTRRNVFLCYAVWEGRSCWWTCCLCGSSTPHAEEMTFEHVVPRSKGGATCWSNIGLAHAVCNGRKGNRTLREAGMTLHVPLREPTEREIIERRIRHQFPTGSPEGWGDFLSTAYWDQTLDP